MDTNRLVLYSKILLEVKWPTESNEYKNNLDDILKIHSLNSVIKNIKSTLINIDKNGAICKLLIESLHIKNISKFQYYFNKLSLQENLFLNDVKNNQDTISEIDSNILNNLRSITDKLILGIASSIILLSYRSFSRNIISELMSYIKNSVKEIGKTLNEKKTFARFVLTFIVYNRYKIYLLLFAMIIYLSTLFPAFLMIHKDINYLYFCIIITICIFLFVVLCIKILSIKIFLINILYLAFLFSCISESLETKNSMLTIKINNAINELHEYNNLIMLAFNSRIEFWTSYILNHIDIITIKAAKNYIDLLVLHEIDLNTRMAILLWLQRVTIVDDDVEQFA